MTCPHCQSRLEIGRNQFGATVETCPKRGCGYSAFLTGRAAPAPRTLDPEPLPVTRSIGDRILWLVVKASRGGITSHEIAATLGLPLVSVRCRLTDMKRDGLVRDSGRTVRAVTTGDRGGAPVSVVVATDEGRARVTSWTVAPECARDGCTNPTRPVRGRTGHRSGQWTRYCGPECVAWGRSQTMRRMWRDAA